MRDQFPRRYEDASPEVKAMVYGMAQVFYGGDLDAAWRAVLSVEDDPEYQAMLSEPLTDEAELQLRASLRAMPQ